MSKPEDDLLSAGANISSGEQTAEMGLANRF